MCGTATLLQLLFKHSGSPLLASSKPHLLKVPPNWGQTKCIQSSKREKYFYFSWRPLFSWLDLTEHDWLPIESLFRFIVFAHSVDRMLVAGLKIMCLLLSVIHFGCWCSTGCIICSLCNILNVCRIKLYIKGGKVRKTTTLKSNFLGGCSSCYNNLVEGCAGKTKQ